MEPWWEKFRRLRVARGWSHDDAARQFVAASDEHTDAQVDTARRNIIRWEKGGVREPRESTKQAVAQMFDLPYLDFWAVPQSLSPVLQPLGADEFAALVAGLRSPRVGRAQLEQAEAEVERLCSAYASQPAQSLLAEVTNFAHELESLIKHGRVNLAGHRQVLQLAGWLALLRSCLLWDEGDEIGSQHARVAADGLAEDIAEPVIAAWGWEIRAWIALTKGDWPQTIRMANAGIERAPGQPVAAQLHAQRAKAYARLGDRHKTEAALEAVRTVLDANPEPINVRNHFAVDPIKASFYAMDAYRVIGANDLADTMAASVMMTSTAYDGRVTSPMRLAEAQLTRAVVLARTGDVYNALGLAEQALAHERRSIPHLQLIANEVSQEVARQDPATAADFVRHVSALDPARP